MPNQPPANEFAAKTAEGVQRASTQEGLLAPETPYVEAAETDRIATRKARAAKARISKLADQANARVDRASALAADLNSRASAAYDRACAKARDMKEQVDPLVHERPYAAIAVAASAGLLLGLLLGRGPKVIYVKPRV